MLNIFTKVINNIERAKYRKIRKVSLMGMEKHYHDEDPTMFMYWAMKYERAVAKYINISND